jgi:RNA polymerase sigma factor (sigma-70 family)
MNTVEALPEAPTDQATVDALRLFEQHAAALYRFCRFTLRRADEAEDVVQETFLKLLQHLRGGGETANLRAWLYTVAANACRDRLRSRRRWLPWQREFDERPAHPAAVEPDLKRANEALRVLAPRDRLLLSLRVHGLSYREIAAAACCAEIGELIGKLYAIERLVPGPFPGDGAAQTLRQQLRTERSQPVLDRMWKWATEQAGLPRSDFAKAVRYMLERSTGLTRFVTNPRIPLDNNAAERALRGPVVGRKNHYGSRSTRGTRVAALFYTLCETAKLVGIDPHAYLLHALYAAIAKPGAITYPDDLLTPQSA